MKPIIVIAYYNRPNLVRNVLETLKYVTCPFELAIVDDGSDPPFSNLGFTLPTPVTIYRIDDTREQKIAQGGSRHGMKVNQAIIDSTADFAIVVCDDDALIPGAVEQLCEYYEKNPTVMYSYSHIITLNPLVQKWNEVPATYNWYNRTTGPIAPACNLDSSQVTFRTKCFKEDGVHYPFPQTGALDENLFRQLTERYGLAPFNGVTLQYKGIYLGQLGNRADSLAAVDAEK